MNRISIEIIGPAASGKTRAALAIRDALAADGWHVIHDVGEAIAPDAVNARAAGHDRVAVINEHLKVLR